MLPRNHQVTKIVAAINNSSYEFSSLETSYLQSLNPQEQNEYRQIIALHQRARERYNAWHPIYQRGERTANADALPRYYPQDGMQPQVVNHIYVRNSSWHDWWFWHMLTWDMMHSRSCSSSSNSSSKRDGESNTAQILLATLLVLSAAVSTLYQFIEIGRCVDQLAYAEDILGNLSRITLGVVGALAGGFAGFAFGAGVLAMPILGAIVGALIVAGASIWASKYLIEGIHRLNPSQSALHYDPRFCLSLTEQRMLGNKGYDVQEVSEAIREVAIAYDKAHKSAWSLPFWSTNNKDKASLTDLLRLLKSGLVSENFDFNNKTFQLKGNAHAPLDATTHREATAPPPPYAYA